MQPPRFRSPLLLALMISAALAFPGIAHAHKLNLSADPNRPLIDYIWLGALHMLAGWDHLLFIAGVVLLAGTIRSAAKLVSLFVAGHSLTLLVATLAGWKLHPAAVDVVIALSVVYVGVQGLIGRPRDWRLMGGIVFAFGLVHGLGLSTRLQELGLPDDGLVPRILLFNLGIELGQLAALTVVVAVGRLLVRQFRRAVAAQRLAFGSLVGAGLVAAIVLSVMPGDTDSPAAASRGLCTESDWQPPSLAGGGHPAKDFYKPEEEAPVADFVHVLVDRYVVVLYHPTLPSADQAALKGWVQEDDRAVVAGAQEAQWEMVRALTAERKLSCSKLHLEALTLFRNNWFARIAD